jgi:hypothetical protein
VCGLHKFEVVQLEYLMVCEKRMIKECHLSILWIKIHDGVEKKIDKLSFSCWYTVTG